MERHLELYLKIMNSQIVADLTSAQGHKDKHQPSKPINAIKTKDIYKAGIKIGSVSVLLNLHNNIVTPGETVAFTAELMNQSKDTIVVAAASISQVRVIFLWIIESDASAYLRRA